MDDFPYKSKTLPKQAVIECFERLVQYLPTINTDARFTKMLREYLYVFGDGHKGPMILQLAAEDYLKYNLISDWYIEPIRLRAIRTEGGAEHESVIDYWNKHKAEILKEAAVKVADLRVMEEAREIVYARKKEVGTFRPTVATGFIKFMRANMHTRCDYVLDPCAGWGDRLIGCMAAHVVRYTSTDPNAQLAPYYQQMIADFAPIANAKVSDVARQFHGQHIISPFEDVPAADLLATLPAGEKFDLVFTSPPYFDLELYDKSAANQSTSRYGQFDAWYRNFFLASFGKAASCLRVGGILAIIITDIRQYRFTNRMPHDIIAAARQRGVEMHFNGAMVYAEINEHRMRTPQPIWLWSRVK